MNRGIIVVVVVVGVVGAALASCKGAGSKKRVPDGEKASAALLIRTIEAVRDVRDQDAVLLLAQGVSEVCGKGCECLARAAGDDAGDKVKALYDCPSVCTPDARAKAIAAAPGARIEALATACTPEVIGLAAASTKQVGDDWLAAFVSGQYLADAYDAANADDKKAYEAAFDGFLVPLAPTAGMAGVALAGAASTGPLGRSRTFVVLDAKGAIRAGTMHGARFTPTGAAYVPATVRDFPDADSLGKKVHEAKALDVPLAGAPGSDDALAKAPPTPLDDPPPPADPADDPPPPMDPDDDDEDDVEDYAGGTGTATALEEGKMGPKSSDRAEGQYRMKKNADDPQLARQQAIEAARSAGILGELKSTEGGAFASLTGTGDISSGFDDVDALDGGGFAGGPVHSVVGVAGPPLGDEVLVFADAAAPATKLLEVLSALPDGAVLAIDHQGRSVALPLVFAAGGFGFRPSPGDDGSGPRLVIEVGKDTPPLAKATFADHEHVTFTPRDDATVAHVVAAFDAALAAGLKTVVFERATSDGFGPGSSGTGWGTIGTGRYGALSGSGTFGSGRGGMRGGPANGPSVAIGQPNAAGDLDKAIIRRYVKRNLQKITYCYEKELLTKPDLAGTVTVQFVISPRGDVASSNAAGVDAEVAACVARVIKAIEFPKPKGGGSVQVNYPFSFRQARDPAQK